MWASTETNRPENSTAATNGQPAARAAWTCPGSVKIDSTMVGTKDETPTAAWNCRGFTPSICFISTAPRELHAEAATTNSRPAEALNPCGSHITSRAPARVRAIPTSRRPLSCSPRMNNDSTVVMGTPSWLTMDTADGLAVFRAMNTREKVPPPIRSPTSISFQRGRGRFLSQGNTAITTTANRMAA